MMGQLFCILAYLMNHNFPNKYLLTNPMWFHYGPECAGKHSMRHRD